MTFKNQARKERNPTTQRPRAECVRLASVYIPRDVYRHLRMFAARKKLSVNDFIESTLLKAVTEQRCAELEAEKNEEIARQEAARQQRTRREGITHVNAPPTPPPTLLAQRRSKGGIDWFEASEQHSAESPAAPPSDAAAKR